MRTVVTIAACSIVAGLAVAIPTGAATARSDATASVTAERAVRAVERKVKRTYRNRVGDRDVFASCRKISRRFFDCEYDVFKNFNDGFNDPNDSSPYKYSGVGSVRQARSGALVVRVSKPR